jgi:hypothetical protein
MPNNVFSCFHHWLAHANDERVDVLLNGQGRYAMMKIINSPWKIRLLEEEMALRCLKSDCEYVCWGSMAMKQHVGQHIANFNPDMVTIKLWKGAFQKPQALSFADRIVFSCWEDRLIWVLCN